jgi:hypothetical protein
MTEAFKESLPGVPALFLADDPLKGGPLPLFRIIGSASLPLLLNCVLLIFLPEEAVTGVAWAWLAYFAALQIYLLLAGRWVLLRWLSAMEFADSLLPFQEDRERIRHLFKSAARTPIQLAVCSVTSIIFILAAILATPVLTHRLDIGPASYFAIGLVVFVGMNGGYWIVLMVLFLRAVQRTHVVAVRRLDPLRTPAITELTKASEATAVLTLITFFLAELPVVASLVLAHRNPIVLTLNVAAPIFALAFVLSIMILPQYLLSQLVTREKARTLQIIANGQLADSSDASLPGASDLKDGTLKLNLTDRYQLYSTATSMAETTYGRSGVLRLFVAVVTIALPYIVQAILHFVNAAA